MAIDSRFWKAGRISFPIFPIIVLIAVLAVVASIQFQKQPVAASNFTLDASDIRATKIQASPDTQKVDFIVYLTPTGTKHVTAWATANPNSVVSLAYGSQVMGKLSLGSATNPNTLHVEATPETAMASRYLIAK